MTNHNGMFQATLPEDFFPAPKKKMKTKPKLIEIRETPRNEGTVVFKVGEYGRPRGVSKMVVGMEQINDERVKIDFEDGTFATYPVRNLGMYYENVEYDGPDDDLPF